MSIRVSPPRLGFSDKLKLAIFKLTGIEVLDYDTLIKLVQNKEYLSKVYNYPYKRRRLLRAMYNYMVISNFESRIRDGEREKSRIEEECERECRSGNVHSCNVCKQKLAGIIKELEYYTTMRGLIDVITEPLDREIISPEYLQVAYEAADTLSVLMQHGLKAMGTDVGNKASEIISSHKASQRKLKIESELERESVGGPAEKSRESEEASAK